MSAQLVERPVVVTGLGVVGPYGTSVDATFAALVAGRSAIRELASLRDAGAPTFVAAPVLEPCASEVLKDRRTARQLRTMDPIHQWALEAALVAVVDAGLATVSDDDLYLHECLRRAAVTVGTGLSGRAALQETLERTAARLKDDAETLLESEPEAIMRLVTAMARRAINPISFLHQCPSIAASQIAIRLGATGPNLTTMSLCAAGAQAIGEATMLIARGQVDVAIAGGADSMLHPVDATAFHALGAISSANSDGPAACKPFDVRRDGTVLGEGAAFMVLESAAHAQARGAAMYARVAGYGTTHDAHKLSAPHPDGAGAATAMRLALASGDVATERIGLINAHATGTLLNDPIEANAIRSVFGARTDAIPVVSTKSLIGHWIAAAGAIEAVVCVMSLVHQQTHATANLLSPDPRCDLNHVAIDSRPISLDAVLSNSFAIGGVNACLVFDGPPT